MQEENQIRSFIVLMDKNKDTQWLEDGVFVPNPLAEFDSCCDNPLPKPCVRSTLSFQDALGVLCGIDYVLDVSVTPYAYYAIYTVTGYIRSNQNLKVQRKVTLHHT